LERSEFSVPQYTSLGGKVPEKFAAVAVTEATTRQAITAIRQRTIVVSQESAAKKQFKQTKRRSADEGSMDIAHKQRSCAQWATEIWDLLWIATSYRRRPR
jgi:hypothetical protein